HTAPDEPRPAEAADPRGARRLDPRAERGPAGTLASRGPPLVRSLVARAAGAADRAEPHHPCHARLHGAARVRVPLAGPVEPDAAATQPAHAAPGAGYGGRAEPGAGAG